MLRRMYLLPLVFAFMVFFCPAPAEAAASGAENTVLSDSGDWALSRSAAPWETLVCRGVVKLAGDGQQTVTCRLCAGLEFGTVISVLCRGEPVNASFYTIVTSRLTDESAFALHLSEGAGAKGDELEIQYTVRLNDAAEIGGSGNHFCITLSDGNGIERRGEEGTIYTWSAEIYRGVHIPEAPGQSKPVYGSCLCLYEDPELRRKIAFTVRGTDEYLACSAEDCPHTRHTYVMRTPGTGKFRLEGLKAGTYYLRETRPPDGMTATAEAVEITVTENGRMFASGVECGEGTVAVIQNAASAGKTDGPRTLLDCYRIGSRILVTLLTVLVATRRYYLY